MRRPRMWMECGVWPPPVREQGRPSRCQQRGRQRAFVVGVAVGAALGATIGSVMALVLGGPFHPSSPRSTFCEPRCVVGEKCA